jgi:hypothetical protein
MWRVISLLCLVAKIATGAGSVNCGLFTVAPNSVYAVGYLVNTTRLSWNEALTECSARHGSGVQLAMIRDGNITGDVLGQWTTYSWIGLSQLSTVVGSKVGWFWIDGVSTAQRVPPWQPGEPDNIAYGSSSRAQCAGINPGGGVYDELCSSIQVFTCEVGCELFDFLRCLLNCFS